MTYVVDMNQTTRDRKKFANKRNVVTSKCNEMCDESFIADIVNMNDDTTVTVADASARGELFETARRNGGAGRAGWINTFTGGGLWPSGMSKICRFICNGTT